MNAPIVNGPVGRSRRRFVAALLALCVATAAGCAGQTTTIEVTVAPDGDGSASGSIPATTTTPPATPSESSTTTVVMAPTVTTTTVPTTTAATVTPLTGWEAVDRYLEIAIVRDASQAASVAVMIGGELVHTAAFGTTSTDGATPVTPDDRFRIASISKPIAAIAALQLVEDGVLSLDAPIGASLAAGLGVGSPAAGVADITLRHLLTHRSGFGQYEDLFFAEQVGSCPEAAVVGLGRALSAAPGTTFRYSNLNFCLVGLVIEQATGRPFADVVQEGLLGPLGIEGMRLAGTFDVQPGDVEHRSDAGRNYMEVLGAAGAWVATPTDVVRIVDSIDAVTDGPDALGAALLAEMTTITTDPPAPVDPSTSVPDPTGSTLPPEPADAGYGMGLMIFGPGAFGHTGTLESTRAMAVRRPDGITWAITVSGDHPASTRQLARMMDNALVLGGFADGEIVPVATVPSSTVAPSTTVPPP